MRVKVSTTAPLPPLKAWFPLAVQEDSAPLQTISSFKSRLCAGLPALRGIAASGLRLSIDGFELLDDSELSIVRDGDLICIDARNDATVSLGRAVEQNTSGVPWAGPQSSIMSRKRKRSTPSSSSSKTDTESSTSSSTSDSDSESESDTSSDDEPRTSVPSQREKGRERPQVTPSVQPPAPLTFVPPGYGKPQTRSRNLRRRLKRMHERETGGTAENGPASGANAMVAGEKTTPSPAIDDAGWESHTLMSLSLRNKNKAKNFRSLLGKPLPPKIIFGDEGPAAPVVSAPPVPRLIPPSSRTTLPPNLFVSSVDVEANVHRKKNRKKERKPDEAAELESTAEEKWDTLERLVNEAQAAPGAVVGYKALGIDPVTYTPEQLLTAGRVLRCDARSLLLQPLRERDQVLLDDSSTEDAGAAEVHTWEEIRSGDWRVMMHGEDPVFPE